MIVPEFINNLSNKLNSVDNTSQPNNLITFDISNFETESIRNKIIYNDFSDEIEQMIFIKNNIDTIAQDILENGAVYSNILVNENFINSFTRAINSISITYTIKLMCNKVAYDYFTCDNQDNNIKQKYLEICKVVNKDTINKLICIGLDCNTACNLSLCRYSSMNERTNVKRLNFVIYFKDPCIMDEQKIVYIYEKLFDRISDLFYATMFEVYSVIEQDNFGENFSELYGTVGNCVLLILNNMTSEKIIQVLNGYNAEYEYRGRPPIRFSLHALSNDYSRINKVVETLSESGVYIP